MLSVSVLASRPVPVVPSAVPPGGELLDEVGSCPGSHVLVLGERRAEVIAGLIRRGCLAATSLRPGAEPEARAFDVVAVTRLAPGDDLDGIVGAAWRALKPRGNLVAALADGTPGGGLGLELERRLRLHGFDGTCIRGCGRSSVLRATLKEANPAVHHG